MDARDIKEQVPVIEDHKYLEKIYELQKGLLDHYVKIEGLPPYPIDVNTKKSQVLIKDFVGRVIEELGEGYESMIAIDNLSRKNLLWQSNYPDEDYKLCINQLQNVSEEFADAMHFMVELLIYVNIQPEDILNYMKKVDKNLEAFMTDQNIDMNDIIIVSMIEGVYNFLEENQLTLEIPNIDLLKVDPTLIPEENISLYQAAKRYSYNYYLEFKKALWDVTYHLNIARNFLKNKPWKQSQMMTDEIRFQEEIVKAFIRMMGAFWYIGLESETLFYIYFKKNRANAFRIKSNY